MILIMLALVLAAGAGGRMGGGKARLLLGGEPLARLHARRARELGCARVVVVVRAQDAAWLAGDAEVAVSAAPDQAGSLAVGARALAPGDDDPVLVTPVDTPPAGRSTLDALLAGLSGAVLAATPVHGGRGGHPVLLRGRVLAPYLRGETPPLSEVLRGLGARRVRVDVDDAAVGVDLDTPEDVLRVAGVPPSFFREG